VRSPVVADDRQTAVAAKVVRIPRTDTAPVSYDRCIATTAGGMEEILARELEALGASVLERSAGAVIFRGSPALFVRANRELRSASRVLLSLFRGPVRDDRDIYERVSELPWEGLLPLHRTFAVTATSGDAAMRDTRFLALRVKDAIVDRQRARFSGKRSSVDRRDPGLRAVLHVEAGDRGSVAELSLDGSLRPLHERGYRTEAGEAPLRETVAAAMLLAAGWRADDPRPLIDPFCGSGTIAIEAAMIRAGIVPGALGIRGYGYERWGWFAPTVAPPAAAPTLRRSGRTPIICADVDPEIVAVAQRNARRAGVEDMIEFIVCDVRDIEAALQSAKYAGLNRDVAPGLIATNPPYGTRLSAEGLVDLYRSFGHLLKQRFPGWEAWTLSENRRDAPRLALRPARTISTYNGSLACRISRYRLHSSTSP